MKEVGLLVLGWLLGLLGPAVIDAIRRRRENAVGRAAVLSELREVGCLLSSATWGALHLQGKADRALQDWVKNDLEQHGTGEHFDKIVTTLRKTLTWDDDELRKYNACLAREHDGKGTMLQRYPVPLLDARVSALWSFDSAFQRGLLEVRTGMHMLDDLVARSRTYFDWTFTLQGEPLERAKQNLRQVCDIYADRARKTVNLIRGLADT
jgi:hypothetical protein